MKKVLLGLPVIALTFFPVLLLIFGAVPYAKATLTSTNVVFVPSASNPHGGTLPTTDPAFAAFSFGTMAWADVNAANLAPYDTVVLMISTSTVPLSASQQLDLINWVDGGGKLIIYDSETVPSVDYSWLPYPMTTVNPGAMGYIYGNITFVEYNTLGCTDPGNVTYYINTTIVPTGGWWDGVGDCNTFLTSDPHWYGDIKAQNYYSYPPSPGYNGTAAGWVHTYASYGDGLFIYNGFDIDPLLSSSVPDPTVLYDGNLAKIWLMELQQPWGIHYNLPGTKPALYYDVTIKAYCYTEDAYVIVGITMDGTPTGFNTPHTFTDLNGTHTFTVPSTDSNGHPFIQWCTDVISTTITVTSDGTYTAYYRAMLAMTIYVDDSNSGGPWDGTKEHPYQNITSALEHALVCDTIFVYNGTYFEHVNVKRSLNLRGENASTTIIDGGETGTVITITAHNVNISGFTVRNSGYFIWDGGISVVGYGNNISHNIVIYNEIGILLSKSSYNTLSGNEVTGNLAGIFLYDCSNNTFTGNIVSNNGDGIYLDGPLTFNNRFFHNNFIDNTYQVSVGSSYNAWDDGYPSGGNYWSDYTGVDKKNGPNQDVPGSDGMGDTPYTIDVNNRDRYPLMNPWSPPIGHDVAVISVVPSKTAVGQGYATGISVYVTNQGEYAEIFNITVYTNLAYLASQNVTLESGNSTVLTFRWNTTGWVKGNYTIKAIADTVPGETDTADNTRVDGWVFVGLVGDVNADGIVDIEDIYLVSLAYGSLYNTTDGQYWHPTPCAICPHSPNLDINWDVIIDIEDIYITALHYGEKDP